MEDRKTLVRKHFAALTGPQRAIINEWVSGYGMRSLDAWPGWSHFTDIAPHPFNQRLEYDEQPSAAMNLTLRFRILHRDNYTCQYCGTPGPNVRLTIDHVVPTSAGGKTEPSNLVACCYPCNHGKRGMMLDNAPHNEHISPLPKRCDRCDGFKGSDMCKGVEFGCNQQWANVECVGWGGYCCQCGAAYAYDQIGVPS